MTLKYEVASLDGLDDDVKALYTEMDGKFRLSVDGLPKAEDVSGLKDALAKEREAAKSAKKWAGLGKSPDEIKELLEAQEAAEQERLRKDGEYDKILSQHQEKWNGEREELSSRAKTAEAALKNYVGETAFVTELARQRATEEGIKALPGLFLKRIAVGMDGGRPLLNIVGADGETPMAGSASDGKATISDLVAEASEAFPSLFKHSGKGGGGMPPKNGPGRPTKKFDEMNGAELSKLRREDPAEYARLRAEYKGA